MSRIRVLSLSNAFGAMRHSTQPTDYRRRIDETPCALGFHQISYKRQKIGI
jgi:hypothetical protein